MLFKGKTRDGDNNPNWKGGVKRNQEGYILIYKPNHPDANSDKYVKRAKLVLEQKLGRYLKKGCIPHHLNKIVDDDRPENLIELTTTEHNQIHKKGFCGGMHKQDQFKYEDIIKFAKENPHLAQHKIASVFNVSQPTVSRILRGEYA